MVDKTDNEPKVDGETKKFIEETKKQQKGVDKKVFNRNFNYEPRALVSKLLNQNTQDLKKNWTEIKNKRLNWAETKEIVQIVRMKMTDLIWYWVLLTGFIDFFNTNFWQTLRSIKTTKICRSKQRNVQWDIKYNN